MTTKNVAKKFCCIDCKYFAVSNALIIQHKLTKKHIKKVTPPVLPELDANNKFQCIICRTIYKTHSGLSKHKKKCGVTIVTENTTTPTTPAIIIEDENMTMIKNELKELNEKLAILMMNCNTGNVTNNKFDVTISLNSKIDYYLNVKCKNAVDWTTFLANIDFGKENLFNVRDDYVRGNIGIISREIHKLPLYDRPIHAFEDELDKSTVAHIRYNNKWISNKQIEWNKQIEVEQDDIEDDPVPNSVYGLIRIFDKQKMNEINVNATDSHIILYSSKMDKDCLNENLQKEFATRLIDLASVSQVDLDEVFNNRRI